MRSNHFWRRYDRLLGPDPASDVNDELRFHLEARIEDLIAQGWEPEAARQEAKRQFGDFRTVQQIGQRMGEKMERRKRFTERLSVLLQDLRYTFRTLARDRGFSIVSILILTLAIGANVAVFSVVNTLLLRPLPFPNAQQLIRIHDLDPKAAESSRPFSTDALQELQQRTRTFQQVTGYFGFSGPGNVKLIGKDQPRPLTGISVAGNFFPTLGVKPLLGRNFSAEEIVRNSRPVAILSYPFWKRQFAADPLIIGKVINLDGNPTTIVGVLPDTFDFGSVFSPGSKVDLFTPAIFADMEDWGNTMNLVGRLKPGVTLAQAQAEAASLFPQLHYNFKRPDMGVGYSADLSTLKDYVSGKLRRSLIVLWCAVGMILLIACVNLSSLLLARSAARSREFAIRTALGAGRARIIRQLLMESLLLSLAGAVLGLGLAYGILGWLSHQNSIALPLLSSLHIDSTALAWTLLVAIAASLLFSLMPGIRLATGSLQEALKEGGQATGEGKSHQRMRSVLVVCEVALACVLLVGAGLLLRSFLHVLDVDLGFQPSHSAAISVSYDDGGDPVKRGVILQQILQRVEQIPGVETAGISDNLPLTINRSWGIDAKGHAYRKHGVPDTFVYLVTPGYLRAMGMHLVQGRDIAWEDTDKKQAVVIVNETVARYLWPGEDPIGKIAIINGSSHGYAQVIGVVADVHETSAETAPGWQMYLSETAPQFGPVGAHLVIRTKLPPASLASSVMGVLREINPAQPAYQLVPIQTLVDRASSPRRFFVLLVAAFAGLGLLLAALGIYGVISYSVTRRTQEIGIRMALGATTGIVQRGVVLDTLRLTLAGIALGAAASLASARLITSLLFATSPWDATTYAGMIVALIAVALVSGYLPARRASRINPLIALRSQ
ncbi:MAG TPA: ABC transporter permease [Acidobacteriaceae bacterium]|jgi:predicted permease|nr:ABC transporter permease [Acidobacteriaceae bacterium]